VRNVDRKSDPVDGERVMDHNVCGRVIVVFSHNVVPCSRREMLEGNRSGIPLFQPVIENSPHAPGIERLPTEVVNPAVENLLALELNRLRSVFDPVPPLLPQAPQVNQLVESSTSASTVALVGLLEGAGEGEGDGDAPGTDVPARFEPVLPPQPIIAQRNATRMIRETRFHSSCTSTSCLLFSEVATGALY
jgi:hypothetical protein